MRNNKWVWTAAAALVMALGFLADTAALFFDDDSSAAVSANAFSEAKVSMAPWTRIYAPQESDDAVWGVKKRSAAASGAAGSAQNGARKRPTVRLQTSKERQYLCVDDRCYLFIGMNSENHQNFALFSRTGKASKKRGKYTHEEKIIKFKEGDVIEDYLVVSTLGMHEMVLHAADINKTYRIDLFKADISRYRIGGDPASKAAMTKGNVQ